MAVAIRRLTSLQERVLAENYEHIGPLLLSRDVHAMLDCSPHPDPGLAAGPSGRRTPGLDVPLCVPFNAKLREEFFGGILFDCDRHRHYMLDHDAFDLVQRSVNSPTTGRTLLEQSDSLRTDRPLHDTLAGLLSNDLLAPSVDGGTAAIEVFPARDLSLAYLQSPVIVEVELTYGCFRACRHCAYESSPDARRPDELSAEEWRAVFEKLAAAGVLILQLTGGDPLFRKDAFEIIEAGDDAGLSVYVRSDTVALNSANIERLEALRHLWHIGTSIDGASAATHDWMRGRGAFALLRERIGLLAAAGIQVAAGATLHKNNFATVRDIGRQAAEFGARWFDIGFLSPVGRGVDLIDLVLNEDEIYRSLDAYLDGIRDGDYVSSHAHYMRRVQSQHPYADFGHLVARLPYLTEWPFSRLRVDPSGFTYTAGKLKDSGFSGGYHLLHRSVDDIWDHSPNLQQLRAVGDGARIHSLDYRVLRSSQ